MSTPLEAIYLQRTQRLPTPRRKRARRHRESDPPIVVRDGRTDHMAKGRAEGQRGQSTHARDTNTPNKACHAPCPHWEPRRQKDPKHRFRSLARLLDRQMLGEAFRRLKRRAAPGIDGVTAAEYAENLDENLLALESRLKAGKYRARPVKRRWISKAGKQETATAGDPRVGRQDRAAGREDDPRSPSGRTTSSTKASATGPDAAAPREPGTRRSARRWEPPLGRRSGHPGLL